MSKESFDLPAHAVAPQRLFAWFVAFKEVSTVDVLTAENHPAQLEVSFGADALVMAAAYPLSGFDSCSTALAAVQGDRGC